MATSRLASRTAQSSVSYGAMVHLSQSGASQLGVSLVGSTSYLAPLFFGVQGGSVADSLSKRIALAFGFAAQSALCLLAALFFGTSVGGLMLLMFMTSLLMQVVTPSLKAAVAVVSTPAEMASVNAIISLVGSAGSAIGATMIAPFLISVSGMDTVLYVAAGLFAIGAVRALRIEGEDRPADTAEALRSIEWKPNAISIRTHADWIVEHHEVATMILTGAIVIALFEAFSTLIPIYVRDVLGANPAQSVYIFAPAGLGFLIGTVLAPVIIFRYGERKLAVISLFCMVIGMVLFGLIPNVAPVFAFISPLRLLEIFGVHLSDEVLAASVISMPTNFGSTSAGAAVDNFVNRHVPVEHQGATFGLQEVQNNGLTLFTILSLGVVSSLFGSQVVMIVAPLIATLAVLRLLRYSFKRAGEPLMTRREAFQLLTSGAEHLPAPVADGADG